MSITGLLLILMIIGVDKISDKISVRDGGKDHCLLQEEFGTSITLLK